MEEPNLIMLDLETLAVAPTATVLQIGAVNILKPHLDFNITVNPAGRQLEYATRDGNTVAFWEGLSEQVRSRVLSGTTEIDEALTRFASWLPKNAKLFCHGAAFDFPILHFHYAANELSLPWHYRNLRCFRTIWEQFKDGPYEKEEPLFEHDALCDAHAQAATFRQIYAHYPEIAK